MRRWSEEPSNGGIFGENAHLFAPDRYPFGDGRQYVTSYYPLTSVSDPHDLADDLTYLYGVPNFLWVAGDGNNPTIGPTLAASGVPTVADTPWSLANGDRLASEAYDGTAYRSTATVVAPANTDDIVGYIGLKIGPSLAAGARFFLSTFSVAQGFCFYRPGAIPGSIASYIATDGGAITISITGQPLGSWLISVLVINRDGNAVIYGNGIAGVPVAMPAGAMSGSGVGIAAKPGGATPAECDIAFAGFTFGSGIADTWLAAGAALVNNFTQRFSGLKPFSGDFGSYSRATAASGIDSDGIHRIYATGLPRAGDSTGALFEPSRTNDCYNNINNAVTTGWSITGGTHTTVADTAALAAAGLQAYGPNVHRFVPGGADQVIYGGAQTGDVDPQSVTVPIRGLVGGESVDIVLRDVSAGTTQLVQTVVLTTAYQIFTVSGVIPSDIDCQFGLDCDAGDTVYFVATSSEEGEVATSIIPNWSTIAAAVRAVDDLVLPVTPSAIEGSIELEAAPQGWSGAAAGISPLLWLTAGGTAVLYVNAGGTWECNIDGTTQLDSGVAPVDGVYQHIRLRWNTGGLMSIDVDGVRVSGTYDGSLLAGGTWEIAATGGPFMVREVMTKRNGGG